MKAKILLCTDPNDEYGLFAAAFDDAFLDAVTVQYANDRDLHLTLQTFFDPNIVCTRTGVDVADAVIAVLPLDRLISLGGTIFDGQKLQVVPLSNLASFELTNRAEKLAGVLACV